MVAVAALLLSLAPGAAAAVVLEAERDHTTRVEGDGAADVPLRLPFTLDAPGRLYAKLLVTPWNAVNPGTPQGEVSADHRAGVRGWWIAFALADGAGVPLAADAEGRPLPPSLGAFVDSTPTPLVSLAPGAYELLATIHVPAEARAAGGSPRVAFALAYRAPGDGGAGSSGASLDESHGHVETLALDAAAAPTPGPPPASDTAPGTASADAGLTGALLPLLLLAALAAVAALVVLALRRRRPPPAQAPPPARRPPEGPPPRAQVLHRGPPRPPGGPRPGNR